MQIDSEFLLDLLGKPVRIVTVNESCLPPLPALVLAEVSDLGIVAADGATRRFFPWPEIVEIHPAEDASAEDSACDAELVDALLGLDSEP